MSELTLNGGAAILRACVSLPLAGVWSAALDVDSAEDITGAVSVEIDGTPVLLGTVVSGGVTHGLWRGRIVGGAGGLRGTLPARAYRDITLADVVRDALAESGETLSSTSGDLSALRRLWHRAEGAAARTLTAVADAAGYGWRVLPRGDVWVGAETWPDAPDADLSLIDRDPSQRRYTLGGDVVGLRPGTLLQLRDDAGDVFVRLGALRLDLEPNAFTATVWAAP